MTTFHATLRSSLETKPSKLIEATEEHVLTPRQFPWSSYPQPYPQPSDQEVADWTIDDCTCDGGGSYVSQIGTPRTDFGSKGVAGTPQADIAGKSVAGTSQVDLAEKSFLMLIEELRCAHFQEMSGLQEEVKRLQQYASKLADSNVVAIDGGFAGQEHRTPATHLSIRAVDSVADYGGDIVAARASIASDRPKQYYANRQTDNRRKSDDSSPTLSYNVTPSYKGGLSVAESVAEAESMKEENEWTCNKVLANVLETAPLVVIMANACTMAISLDVNPTSDVWNILEYVWFGCYSLEFICKVCAFGLSEYFFGFNKHWNRFDFACLFTSAVDLCFVSIMTFIVMPDTSTVFGFLKLLRLARLARLVRTLRYKIFEELKQMVLGVVFGFRVLVWAIVLLFAVISVLGIIVRDLCGEAVYELRTVPNAMFTMFRCFTDGCTAYDGTPLSEHLLEKYGALWFIFYILCFMIVTCGVFNLIMAIFIETVISRSLKRKLREISETKKRIEANIQCTLANLIVTNDPEGDVKEDRASREDRPSGLRTGLWRPSCTNYAQIFSELLNKGTIITKETFHEWLSHKEMEDLLGVADVDTSNKDDLFDVLDVDMSGELGLDELIEGLMRMRGPTTKSDIVAIRLKLRYVTPMIEDIWRQVVVNGKTSQASPV